jgi:hypothetical protein
VRNGCAAVTWERKQTGGIRIAWAIGHSKGQAFRRALNELGQNAKRLAWTCTAGFAPGD